MKQSLKKYYWSFLTQARMFRRHKLPAWFKYCSILVDSRLRAGSAHYTYRKNLILLAWEFPPQVAGGVYRPASLVRYAATTGWKITVLTGPMSQSESPAGRYLVQSIPETVSVHRVSEADIGPHPWPLPNIDGGVLNAITVYETASKLVDLTQPGIIVASGPPFHNFVAAMWLANRTGWRLVLDYRDEWTENPHGFSQNDSTNRAWEGKCLRRADLVVFTTQSQLVHQTRVFLELYENKCVVIHNGWEPEDFMAGNMETVDSQEKVTGTINIAFFGNLGPWCHPGQFLNALEKVFAAAPDLCNHVKIHFVGHKSPSVMSEINQFPYQDALKLTPHVSKSEACWMMKSSDALLLINPPSMSRYIPGKTYDYVASGTPILLFGEGGEMASIVRQMNVGVVVAENDVEGLDRVLRNIQLYPRAANAERSDWLQLRTREILAHKMLAVLDDLRMPSHKDTKQIDNLRYN